MANLTERLNSAVAGRYRIDRHLGEGGMAVVYLADDLRHERKVALKVLKPEHILLHDGRPMVADFGIALAISAAAGGRLTETGLSLGAPHYMSPEQVTHRTTSTDAPTCTR